MRILLVEDEPKLNQSIKTGLEQRGYAVDAALDGEQGETFARAEEYDVIILDIMLPKRDGLTVCKNLRAASIHSPIIFLTAKDRLDDKVIGLDSGADDYLVKPFEFSELLARIRALIRRPQIAMPIVHESDGLKLDVKAQKVSIEGTEVALTLREFRLLEYLMQNADRVLSRQEIIDHVWDMSFDSFSNAVDVHIKNLRQKLKGIYAKKLETVRGVGYRFAQ